MLPKCSINLNQAGFSVCMHDFVREGVTLVWLCVQGRVDVNQETGELRLLVKINAKSQGAEAKKSKAVKDLKQLSGEACACWS